MKKILFIQPPFERLMGYSRYYTNQGLLSLAAVVDEAGHQAIVYDADYDPNGKSYNALELLENYNRYTIEMKEFNSIIWDEVRDVIKEYNPDFLGVCVLSPTLESGLKIIKIAREINKDIKIIVGGAHASLRPEDLVDCADYIIQYEGESVIVDVLEGKIKDKIIKGPRITNLDELPFPAISDLHNLHLFEKRDLSLVMSTRGCPFGCKFCDSPQLWHRRTTRKSVDYFIEEIKNIKEKYKVTDFYISDDSFSVNPSWLNEFCKQIKKLNVTWRCLDRIDSITEEKILLLRDAGCRNLKLGIESGSQQILRKINKNITIEDILSADRILRKTNMDWSAFFMLGFPGETKEDMFKTQNLIKIISAKSVTLSIFTPYPGNELLTEHNTDYKLYSHHSPNNNFTGTMSNSDFNKILVDTLDICEKNYFEHNIRKREGGIA